MSYLVTNGALVARINRKLAKDWKKLHKYRESSSGHHNLGDYYVVDSYRNAIINTHVDVLSFARDLGVIHPGELLAEN
jgi:hypothetical protein